MNREIKFRAWDKVQDAMVNFDIYNVPPYVGQTHLEGEKFERKYEIMQYTGLKDKNGTEIYEGDIIENDGDDAHEVVTFDEGSFWLEGFTYTTPLYEVNTEAEEVIGNIYEHPELLECDEE